MRMRHRAVFRAMELATGAYRSPDPHLPSRDGISSDGSPRTSRKIEFGTHAGEALHAKVPACHGLRPRRHPRRRPTGVRQIRAHLDAAPPEWLRDAAKAAAADITVDFRSWSAAR